MLFYFDFMFGFGMKESLIGFVVIEEMELRIFKKVMNFIYIGEIEFEVELVIVFLQILVFL